MPSFTSAAACWVASSSAWDSLFFLLISLYFSANNFSCREDKCYRIMIIHVHLSLSLIDIRSQGRSRLYADQKFELIILLLKVEFWQEGLWIFLTLYSRLHGDNFPIIILTGLIVSEPYITLQRRQINSSRLTYSFSIGQINSILDRSIYIQKNGLMHQFNV